MHPNLFKGGVDTPTLLCPSCKISMEAATRGNIQFEVCHNCRGIWLERVELERLLSFIRKIEQEQKYAGQENTPALEAKEQRYPEHEYKREHYNDPDRYHHFNGSLKKLALERPRRDL